MKGSILISLSCLISIIVACSAQPTKSLLDERAGYGASQPQMDLAGSGSVRYVPERIPEKVAVAWLHAHELPSKDYFWGSWISIVILPESWEMKKLEVPAIEKHKMKTDERPRHDSRVKAPPKPLN